MHRTCEDRRRHCSTVSIRAPQHCKLVPRESPHYSSSRPQLQRSRSAAHKYLKAQYNAPQESPHPSLSRRAVQSLRSWCSVRTLQARCTLHRALVQRRSLQARCTLHPALVQRRSLQAQCTLHPALVQRGSRQARCVIKHWCSVGHCRRDVLSIWRSYSVRTHAPEPQAL